MSVSDNDNIPFTFVDIGDPHTKYVEVEEAMYNLTLERIRHLVRENAELKDDRITLANEVKLWRRWFDGEEEVLIGEPLFYQDVVNQRDKTDKTGALERSSKEQG